jgi:hypothetical protein
MLSAPLSHTLGPQQTLVVLVNFQDMAIEPWTVADAQVVMAAVSQRVSAIQLITPAKKTGREERDENTRGKTAR